MLIANIEDLRQLARQRTPRPFWSYIESGAFEQLTLAANRSGLDAVKLRPRVLAGVGKRDLRTHMLGQAAVWFDSGIRSGTDVLKALACGASGVLIGRAMLYGLAAQGEAGVRMALHLIRRELDTEMALCGVSSIQGITRNTLWQAPTDGPATPTTPGAPHA